MTADLRSQNTIEIAAFYHFKNWQVDDLCTIQNALCEKARELKVSGLVILAKEGLNLTVSSSPKSISAWREFIQDLIGSERTSEWKLSFAPQHPFRRFRVKIRDEIVTSNTPGLSPDLKDSSHLTPSEWNKVLQNEDVVLIDTRNKYETEIGTFRGAVCPNIDEFTEFGGYFEQQGITKEKKVLIFCTGGIRCEKGILELREKGYQNIYQLEGGILNYLKQYPNELFEGECFVFDHRTAVQQDLSPSQRYKLCPHCGQPGDRKITCVRCDSSAVICQHCQVLAVEQREAAKKETCSKHCASMWSLRPGVKGRKQRLVKENTSVDKTKKNRKDGTKNAHTF